MLKEKYICFGYVALWSFYYLQGLFNLAGSSISKFLLFFLMGVSIVFCFLSHLKRDIPIYIKALDLFILMMTIYGIVYLEGEGVALYTDEKISGINYLKLAYASLLPIYFFYYYARKGVLTESLIKSMILFLLVMVTIEFRMNDINVKYYLISQNIEAEGITNNISYEFLSLIPAMFFFKKKPLVQYLLLVSIVFLIIMGMKRGAILIAAISLPLFFLLNSKEMSVKKKWLLFLMSVGIVAFVAYLFIYLSEHNSYFNERIQQTLAGNSSGRNFLYEKCWNYFWHSTSDLQFLLGSGACATIEVTSSTSAHNDWLELAVNQGVVGVFVYAIYWFAAIKFCRSMNEGSAKSALMLLLFIFFMRTFFSMSYGAMTIVSTSVLGFCVGYDSFMKSNRAMDINSEEEVEL